MYFGSRLFQKCIHPKYAIWLYVHKWLSQSSFPCAARRTAQCDMGGVWQAVLQATSPRDIVDRKVAGVDAMQAARDEVTEEVNKNARMPPKFSADGEHGWDTWCATLMFGPHTESLMTVYRPHLYMQHCPHQQCRFPLVKTNKWA